jgi:hypothetical protein
MTKKQRFENIKEAVKKLVAESDTSGLVMFFALSPDDREPEDKAIPSYYATAGEHGHLASLMGCSMADLILTYEAQSRNGEKDQNVRSILAGAFVTSLKHAFLAADEANEQLAPTSAPSAEYGDPVYATAGFFVNKKGGNA